MQTNDLGYVAYGTLLMKSVRDKRFYHPHPFLMDHFPYFMVPVQPSKLLKWPSLLESRAWWIQSGRKHRWVKQRRNKGEWKHYNAIYLQSSVFLVPFKPERVVYLKARNSSILLFAKCLPNCWPLEYITTQSQELYESCFCITCRNEESSSALLEKLQVVASPFVNEVWLGEGREVK